MKKKMDANKTGMHQPVSAANDGQKEKNGPPDALFGAEDSSSP